MDKKSRQGCLWIGLGVAILVCVVGGAVLGGLAWVAYQSFSLKTESVSADSAEREFEQTRARFAGQAPLIQVGEYGEATVVPRTSPAGSSQLTSVHLLIYNPADHKIARITVPYWLLRLSPDHGTIRFQELRDLKVNVVDVERAGPGLLVDHHEADGSRVLIWSD